MNQGEKNRQASSPANTGCRPQTGPSVVVKVVVNRFYRLDEISPKHIPPLRIPEPVPSERSQIANPREQRLPLPGGEGGERAGVRAGFLFALVPLPVHGQESESVRVGQTFEITNLQKMAGQADNCWRMHPSFFFACPHSFAFLLFPIPKPPRESYQAGRASHHQSTNPSIQRQAPKSHQVAVGSTFENTFQPCWCPFQSDERILTCPLIWRVKSLSRAGFRGEPIASLKKRAQTHPMVYCSHKT